MLTLSEQGIIDAIENGETFEATLTDGSLTIRIQEYTPFLCTAIHAGHQMSDNFLTKCALNDAQRLLEEDPYTEQLIESFPITLSAGKSRYEYDLNRGPDVCIYDIAWGQSVWNTPLDDNEIRQARFEHARYFRILNTLLQVLEQRFGACLLIDLHSYNWQVRTYDSPPTFNIGTHYIDTKRWNRLITGFESHLAKIELPNIDTTVGKNAVFEGKGFQAQYVRSRFDNTLVIPLEIKKIYMDETTGEVFPLVLDNLGRGLHLAVLATAAAFSKKLNRAKIKLKNLQSPHIDPVVLSVDKALFRLAKGIETLHYVNPINIQQEKKRFFGQQNYNPQFKYRQLRLDPYEFREKLYRLPVSQIQDPLLRALYRGVVDSYATKVEMLTTVGTPQFIYNSLRYYGEPNTKDIDNALFLLHAAKLPEELANDDRYSAGEAKIMFEQAAERFELQCKVGLSSRLVAKAMVDNSKKTLLLNRNANLTMLEINALIHHELGVHMVTTANALAQPLKLFRLGLPGNTYTQEGLAILSEYLSGNLDLNRLKQLSLRVLAVKMMLDGKDFCGTYRRLTDDYSIDKEDAFNLTMRVYRGGGFTKDYLYLSGFRDVTKLYRNRNILPLLIGKTDTHSLPTLDSMLERGILNQPKYITPALKENLYQENPVLDYLVGSIN